ncbi:alanine:cation symporter family protein [Clostridium sp. MSJ-11]|uniref:Alanine:cation symporter family protein n=1 Tax=Clostridium mobile TaxID=2841512 RepID=A0ABS6EJN5_9CLOT|nr:alanine/glycine:cation symporter family protein [Clostridium mobile]MBU5485352.1 alanine:cation symporter family protein [Clostridium mobile]
MYAKFIGSLSGFLYTYILPILLIGGGLYFSFKTKFVQLRLLKESIKIVNEPAENEKAMSSFQALMVSTASRVGTGNIIGVSTAICIGGAGSVFWMWIVAFLGASSAFVESTLAQIYKKRDKDGGSYGGPAHYIENGLKNKTLGMIFAIILILTYMVGFNMLAAYNINSAFATYSFYNPKSTPMIVGVVLAALTGVSIFGGGKKLSEIASLLVPIMSVMYIIIAFIIIFKNIGIVPAMFADIFSQAFDFKAIFGGFAGSAIMMGLKRGLYSNEAGIGSAPNAAAAADVSHPAKQGLVQMMSVYLDTWVICTATAIMLLASGISPDPELAGAAYNVAALTNNFGAFGQHFFTFALFLFGFTTLIGNYFYSEANLKYIFGEKTSKTTLNVFRTIAVVVILFGTGMEFGVAWDTADVLMAAMALINIPAIFILKNPVIACMNDYVDQRKNGKNPVFKASSISLKDKTDFWN